MAVASGLQILQEWIIKKYFSYFLTETYVVGAQKNCYNDHPKHIYKLMSK